MSKFSFKKGYQSVLDKAKTIKFYQIRKYTFLVPAVVILIMLICGTAFQLSGTASFANIGVDFQGGTLLNVEMYSNVPGFEVDMNNANYDYNAAIIERIVENHGFTVATTQKSGESAIVVRYSSQINQNDNTKQMVDYGDDSETMNSINEEIISEINNAFKTDNKYVADADKIHVGASASLIGNASSRNLLKTACISVAIALLAMFIYIIIRFSPFFALSTIIALLHDVIIMLAFTVIFRIEIGSTIVAAIITIVAYSINNTIIVFDRVREQLKPLKKANKRYEVSFLVNEALGNTLTRSVYTTLTTLITIVLLAAIARNSTITNFAVPIIFGLIAGFYSSLFIAAPLWGTFTEAWDKHKRNKANPNYIKNKKRFSKKAN